MGTLILTQKLKRNGWPEDEPMKMMDEDLLEYTTGIYEDDNEKTTWKEWRLDGKIVKRGVHVHLKRNVAAESIAAMLK